MTIARSTKVMSFNQLNFGDLIVWGNCFPYTILFFSYVEMYHLKYGDKTEIDYSALSDVLKGYSFSDKRCLNRLLVPYDNFPKAFVADYRALFEEEVAIFNQNDGQPRMENDFNMFCEAIYKNIQNFQSPTLVMLDNQIFKKPPLNKRQERWHIVGLYLSSANEIHFFDANHGLYKLTFDHTNYTLKDLENDLRLLLYKSRLLNKYKKPDKHSPLGASYNKSVYYVYAMSKCTDNLYASTRQLKSHLLSLIENDRFDKEELEDNLLKDPKIRGFFDRCLYVLRTITTHFDREASYSVKK